jgi:quercetin dioxygenase-like cupin family protein
MESSVSDHKPAPGHEDQAGFWVQPDEVEVDANQLAYQPGIFKVAELPSFSPAAGVVMSIMSGANVMANWVRIEPNTPVPLHAHPHEQLGLVLEGAITMDIGGESRTLVPGDCYAIPGTLPHAAQSGPDGCLVLDVFSPVREEYVAAAMQQQ